MLVPSRRGAPAPVLVSLCLAWGALSCGDRPVATLVPNGTVVPAAARYRSEVYAQPANWVCRPDQDDVCDDKLDAAVVAADGTTTADRWAPATDPPVDCFYAYPTVSTDVTPNSDLVPSDKEERRITHVQAARLGTHCRVFAPVYRQATLTTMAAAGGGPSPADVAALAYSDIVEAFRHYLAQDNDGRGFVLIGHSQGAGMLARLLDGEVHPNLGLRQRFVAAYLLGLPAGARPDPSLTPPCRLATAIGCLVAFSAFTATSPPQPGTPFGTWAHPAACTNPAALGGGRAPLRPFFVTGKGSWAHATTIVAPFVTVPGMVEGECVSRDGYTYLEVSVNAGPDDARADDIPGDQGPPWGMHTEDVQLVLGDLMDLLGDQAATWQARR